jgi:energy-coupling factor transporter transmembrane protein EcfT
MADLTLFAYRTRRTLLHGIDARAKLFALVAVSLASIGAGPISMGGLAAVLMLSILRCGVSPGALYRESRLLLLILAAIFVTRAVGTPGTTLAGAGPVSVTREGILAGALICLRLATIILAGLALVMSTRISEIKAAVEWGLRPVPLVPEKRVGTMLGLVVRFLPLIVEGAREMTDAQRARGVEQRKNPIYRLVWFAIPLFRRTFLQADRLSLAMEARCYSEERTDAELTATRADWIFIAAVSFGCLFLFRW